MMKRPWDPRQTVVVVLAAALALGGGLAFYAGSSGSAYVVYAGGDPIRVAGRFEQVADVLAAAGMEPGPGDLVAPALAAPAEPGAAITVDRAEPVTVVLNGEAHDEKTREAYVGPFLAEAGVTLHPGDEVRADGRLVALADLDAFPLPDRLEVETAAAVSIEADGERVEVVSEAPTVGQALAESGVTLYAGDQVVPAAGAWLEPGAEIVVQRALSLTIVVDGQSLAVRTALTRPVDVLAEQGIALLGQDFTRPAATAELESGDTIEVVRVTEAYHFVDEAIPYEAVWRATDTLELDQKQLLTPGAAGVLRRRVRARYENGAPVGEEAAGEWVAQAPVNSVMGYGTRIVVRVLETPEGAYEYWRVVRMRATAYTAASAGKPPDHPGYGITASGLQAGTGIVAVDPRVVPFRSWVYVPGYGLGYAGDTGGGVKGRWIDLGYDEDELRAWNTYVDVYYLVPAPPPDQINYLIPETLP